jgi:hypothetical protein
MTDFDVKRYKQFIGQMIDPALDAETSIVIYHASKGAEVSMLIATLAAEYVSRGNPDGFLKQYNAVIGGLK